MTSITNISYTAENDGVRLLDLHIPDKDSFPVFIYLHGGGLEFGD